MASNLRYVSETIDIAKYANAIHLCLEPPSLLRTMHTAEEGVRATDTDVCSDSCSAVVTVVDVVSHE